MPRFLATCATGCAESRTNRTASVVNSSVSHRRVLMVMLPSDFILFLLIQVSLKSREGQCKRTGGVANLDLFKLVFRQ